GFPDYSTNSGGPTFPAAAAGPLRQSYPQALESGTRGSTQTANLVSVSIRLYDTATRSVRDFVPIQPGKVSIYLCGATVQSPPHIGHIRSGVNFDILSRWLAYRGFRVTFVRNVTDIDDKILKKAAEQGIEFWRLAQANERAFTAAYTGLGCIPPTIEPRATGHIPEMIELMQDLIL